MRSQVSWQSSHGVPQLLPHLGDLCSTSFWDYTFPFPNTHQNFHFLDNSKLTICWLWLFCHELVQGCELPLPAQALWPGGPARLSPPPRNPCGIFSSSLSKCHFVPLTFTAALLQWPFSTHATAACPSPLCPCLSSHSQTQHQLLYWPLPFTPITSHSVLRGQFHFWSIHILSRHSTASCYKRSIFTSSSSQDHQDLCILLARPVSSCSPFCLRLYTYRINSVG